MLAEDGEGMRVERFREGKTSRKMLAKGYGDNIDSEIATKDGRSGTKTKLGE